VAKAALKVLLSSPVKLQREGGRHDQAQLIIQDGGEAPGVQVARFCHDHQVSNGDCAALQSITDKELKLRARIKQASPDSTAALAAALQQCTAYRMEQDFAKGSVACSRAAILYGEQAENPDNWEAYEDLGEWLRLWCRQYVGAAAAYRRALHLNPVAATSYAGLGLSLFGENTGRAAETKVGVAPALASLEIAVKLEPSNMQWLAGLGVNRWMLCHWRDRTRIARRLVATVAAEVHPHCTAL